MPASIPDIILDDSAWTDLNAASGIAVGSAMFIQNKTNGQVNLWLGANPPASRQDGTILLDYDIITVDAGEPKVWALGEGRLNVQVG